jgi:uncharacterized integral membrane protein (TIGR00698 family)
MIEIFKRERVLNKKRDGVEQATKSAGLMPGLLVALAIAIISFITYWFLKGTWLKFSALLWAFIYSIIAINLLPVLSKDRFKPGIDMASSRMLRWTIALLGLTISASVWAKLGFAGIALVLINLVIVFMFGIIFCKYVVRMDSALAILVAVGTSICGASAIAAVGPALKAKAEEMGLSLAVITLFGLAAMLTYPLLFNGPLAGWLGNNPLAYGLWTGTGIHETAQVIAAASQVQNAVSIATSAKFIRIFMIGPMVFVSLFIFRYFSRGSQSGRVKLSVPWFALVFVLLSLAHLGIESLPIRDSWRIFNSTYLSPTVTFLLAWSFAAIGLKVKFSAIRKMGLKVFLGGMAVAVFAGISSLLLVKFFWMPLG